MPIKKILSLIIILAFIDQTLKVVINDYLLKANFEIVPFLFEFRPVFNPKGTYVLNLLNIDIGLGIYILYFGFLSLMTIFYILLRKAKNNTRLFDFAFIFVAAGLACSIIGRMFWEKGCLDYIYLKPLFVFDLKDLYLTSSLCLFLIFLHKKRIKTFKELFALKKIQKNKV